MAGLAQLKVHVWCFENLTLMDRAEDEMEFASISAPRGRVMWCTYRSVFHLDKLYTFVCVGFIHVENMREFIDLFLVGWMLKLHGCCRM